MARNNRIINIEYAFIANMAAGWFAAQAIWTGNNIKTLEGDRIVQTIFGCSLSNNRKLSNVKIEQILELQNV